MMAASIRFRRSGTTAAARCASSALVLTLPGTSHVNGTRHAIVAHLFIMPLVEETAFLLALTTHTSAGLGNPFVRNFVSKIRKEMKYSLDESGT